MDNKKLRDKCRLAINNILQESTTDVEIFNKPFELNYLKSEQISKEITDSVTDAILSGNFEKLKLHKIGHVLVPKKNLCDFRKCALIDIVDEITFLTLVLCVADKIEFARINKSRNRIFSYRYKANSGYLFDPQYHFTAFRKEIERKSKIKTNKVVVECDISNFYDRVNIHRIESSLLSLDNINTTIVSLINQTLLFWANRDSYGLPVGSNASRILSEAALINVDQILLSHKVDFCRFVDDYRIFAKDAQTAHAHLSLLMQCLSREGLFINVQKTKIKDISEIITDTKKSELVSDPKENLNTESIVSTAATTPNNEMPKIIRGYNGLVPTKFKELTKNEIEKLKDYNLKENLNSMDQSILIEPNELTKLIKATVAQNSFDSLVDVARLLKKFPQLLPYFINCVYKYNHSISDEALQSIKIEFQTWYDEENIPEYILIYLIRLFSITPTCEKDKEILLRAFRSLKRVSGDYIGRALLDAFDDKLSRAEVLEIRDYYIRADDWEKRQIIKLVQNKLPDGEKQAFFKNILIHNSDILTKYIASNKKEFIKFAKQK